MMTIGDECDCDTCTVEECDYCTSPVVIVTPEREALCLKCHQSAEDRANEQAAEQQYEYWHGGSSESAESMNIRGAW